MSFGASPADIAAIVKFCRACYRKCKEASGEYLEISREVRGLHTVLRHLKYEVEAPESLLNRDQSTYGRELAPIVKNCDFTLHALDNLIQKYGRLGDGSPSSPRVVWDKIRFGSNEMDELGAIRVKLISHKTSLTLFLDTIQLQQAGKVSTTLDTQSGQLDVILDKVDGIAARMCQRAGSIMTSYDDDDKEVWKQFRRELVAEGFDSAVLHKHKDVLRAYIREIDQQGLLDDGPQDSQQIRPSSGVNPEHWLDSVHSEGSEAPPSFRSHNSNITEDSMKQMIGREENIKFPQSIKAQRGLPESKTVAPLQQTLLIPDQGTSTVKWEGSESQRRTSPVATQRRLSPVPKLITSTSEELQDDELSNSEAEAEDNQAKPRSGKPSNPAELALVIRTSDLVSEDSSMALQVLPSGSPSSFRSYSSFASEDIPQTMAYRAKNSSDFGSVPPVVGLSIPVQSPQSRDGRSSPRPQLRLAPDQNGNDIPPNAKWTRIRRSLVSPEVLDQDHCRYEARPDFVAVLGVLTREQIVDYAARSQELREARRRKNRQQYPPQPPRPVPIAIPRAYERAGRDTPSDDYSDSSEDDERKHTRDDGNRSYPNSPTPSYTHVSRSGYPNPYGVQPPPSPAMSSSSTLSPQTIRHSQNSPREARMHYSHDKDKDRERQERHRRHNSPPRQKSRTSSSHSKGGEKDKSKSRWKENMGAGAVGGAAMSLLHVLSEAAEGL